MPNGKPINPWFIAVTVTLATFMELLDTSIANVALPYIGGGLGRSYDEVTWILTTYLVANAVILPMSAWLSRVFGRKTYYLGCVALFTLTSFFCGLAPSLGIMLSSRVLQGIAGGGLAPVAQAILVDTFGRDYKGKMESLPGAAGPLFSLFPPENSTGNYVKVVQRFPVRIRLNKDQDPEHRLRPGMSVESTVDFY